MKNPILLYYHYDKQISKEENDPIPDPEMIYRLRILREQAKYHALELIEEENAERTNKNT